MTVRRKLLMPLVRGALVSLALCATSPADAQVLRGRLIDDATGRAVAGAEIVLRDATQREVA